MDPKKKRRRLQELGVGAVVVLGLVLLGAGILAIGRENRLFVQRTGFRTIVGDAGGLRAGSPVTMAGVRIGSIDRITLPRNPGADGIELHFSIDRDYAPRLREGTLARLAILQIVANEKVLTLTPGDPQKPSLPPESLIPVQAASPLLETGKNIAETVEQITIDLRDILGAIRNGQGLVGKAIVDPEFSHEALDRLGRAIATTSQLLERVDRGEGLLGKLVADREYSERLTAQVSSIAASLAETSRRIEQGHGVLGQMTEQGPADELLPNLAAFSKSLRIAGDAMQRGDGLAGLLMTDRERSQRIAANLDEAAASLASVIRKVDQGQGTLGLLVNDRSLHDDTEQLIAGAKRNKFVSWIIHRLYKGGAEPPAEGAPESPDAGKPGPQAPYSGSISPLGVPGAGEAPRPGAAEFAAASGSWPATEGRHDRPLTQETMR